MKSHVRSLPPQHMDGQKPDEIDALLAEEELRRLRPRDRLVFVPKCECGYFPSLTDPDVKIEGDLDALPPYLWVICPRCGRKVKCEVINESAEA